MRYAKEDTKQALERLHEWLAPGATVYTILRNVSRSGMSRSISVMASVDGEIFDISYQVSRATGMRIDDRHGGIKIGGWGMDMGFAIAYALGRAMFPDGVPCTGIARADDPGGKRCLSNDHVNSGPQRDCYDTAVIHSDGGYAFRHHWL